MEQCCEPSSWRTEDDLVTIYYEDHDDETHGGGLEPLVGEKPTASTEESVEYGVSSLGLHPLRAVHSSHVLAFFGWIFAEHGKPQSEAEANELYSLSHDVSFVDHFVSHSWSAPRILKWAAIADYFNRSTALVFANTWWLFATIVLLGWRIQRGGEPLNFILAYSLLIGMPALILCFVAAFGHRWFNQSGSQLFVDRICIHQWDDALKQDGINGLGQVLDSAEKIMVLWSEDYFHRMWCIFEVATFEWDPARMVLLPLWVTPLLYAVLLSSAAVLFLGTSNMSTSYYVMLTEAWGLPMGIAWYWSICTLPGALAIAVVIRRGVVQKQAMESWVANFALDQTLISVEADRDFIYSQIRRRFGSLRDFEKLVQTDMLAFMRRVIGPAWSFPYAWGAFALQPYLWLASVDVVSTTNSEIARQLPPECEGQSVDWKLYAIGIAVAYSLLYVLLALTLKVLGQAAYLTLKWPICLGLTLEVIIFALLVFVSSCVNAVVCNLVLCNQVVVESPPLWSQ